MNISYFEITLKSNSFTCLSNSIATKPIVPESCSNPQNNQQVFKTAWYKIFGFEKKINYTVECAYFITSRGLEKSDIGEVMNYANRWKLYHRSLYTLS